MDALELGLKEETSAVVRKEPTSGGANRTRPDLIVTNTGGRLATDVTIATPGTVSSANGGEQAAAQSASRKKRDVWQRWSDVHGMDFCPFVGEASGSFLREALPWLRRILSGRSLVMQDACTVIMDRCIVAMLTAQVVFFTAAGGSLEFAG
jgi:hypothetical protein